MEPFTLMLGGSALRYQALFYDSCESILQYFSPFGNSFAAVASPPV